MNHPDLSNSALQNPLVLRESDEGELFEDAEYKMTEGDLESKIVLDDVHLWDAYNAVQEACRKAHAKLKAALRKPHLSEVILWPTPTKEQIQGIAYYYVKERRRGRRKTAAVFSAIAGRITESEASEMAEALLSNYWIYKAGESLFRVTGSGESYLDTAAWAANEPNS